MHISVGLNQWAVNFLLTYISIKAYYFSICRTQIFFHVYYLCCIIILQFAFTFLHYSCFIYHRQYLIHFAFEGKSVELKQLERKVSFPTGRIDTLSLLALPAVTEDEGFAYGLQCPEFSIAISILNFFL